MTENGGKTMEREYTSKDLARVAPAGCEGCGECCRGMGESVILDPYDAHMLSKGLKRPFAALLNREVSLGVSEGLIVPYLSMDGPGEACRFLGEDKRCMIHEFRPGICRLYPLARRYGEKGVTYFIPDESCPGRSKAKMRVSRWLGIPDLAAYEHFKEDWHRFTADLAEYFAKEKDPKDASQVNQFVLENFYMSSFPEERFFEVIGERLGRVRKVMHMENGQKKAGVPDAGEKESRGIAVIFPGIGYHSDKPLLYYAGKLAAQRGCEVRRIVYRDLPAGVKEDRSARRKAAEAALRQAEEQLADIDWGRCGSVLFISKSIGTVIANLYLRKHGVTGASVCFTPLEETFRFAAGTGIVFHGDADPWAKDTEAIRKACAAAGQELFVYEGANHSLETDDALRDIEILTDVARRTAAFMDEALDPADPAAGGS